MCVKCDLIVLQSIHSLSVPLALSLTPSRSLTLSVVAFPHSLNPAAIALCAARIQPPLELQTHDILHRCTLKLGWGLLHARIA